MNPTPRRHADEPLPRSAHALTMRLRAICPMQSKNECACARCIRSLPPIPEAATPPTPQLAPPTVDPPPRPDSPPTPPDRPQTPPRPSSPPTQALARPMLGRPRPSRRSSLPLTNGVFKPVRRTYNNVVNLELRCYLTLRPFYCGYCFKLPTTPITCNCGHTSCQECLIEHGACSCGQTVSPHGRGVNILVQNLIEWLCAPLPAPAPEPLAPVIATDNSGPWMQKYYNCREWSDFPVPRPVVPARVINKTITRRVARQWIAAEELDCPLCAHHFRRPVTTPCGHTFCRTCLERTLDYNTVCPLCKATLHWFDVELIAETQFVTAAFAAAGLPPPKMVPDFRLPIFACTIAYPMVSCPLFVFEPRYRLMLRRCLRGNRHFGMVAPGPNNRFAEYGTLLEIRDCVRLPNGCSLVSTMGVSRFRVLERGEKDGYAVAHVTSVRDEDTRSLATQRDYLQFLQSLFLEWRNGIAKEDNDAIDATFGPMPTADQWTENDGPAFVWWVTAFLPLPENVKYSMLKKTEVMQRMAMLQKCFHMMLRQMTRPEILNMEPAVGPINHIGLD